MHAISTKVYPVQQPHPIELKKCQYIVNTEITKVINNIHLHLLQVHVYIYHMMISVMYVGVSNLLCYESINKRH